MDEFDTKQLVGRLGKFSIEQLFHESQRLEGIGQYQAAIVVGKEIVKRKPAWGPGHYAVGSAMCGAGMIEDADTALKKAITRDPKQGAFYSRHAEVLNRLGLYDQAVESAEMAIEQSPDEPRYYVVKAMVLRLGGEVEQACDLLETAISKGITSPSLQHVHAVLIGQQGQLEQGIAMLEALIAEGESKAWEDDGLLSEALMSLSRLYDKAGRYDDAFTFARRGGEMRVTGYDTDDAINTLNDRKRAWSRETFDGLKPARVTGDKLVFIVGMPRSGTSLVEQIIASHPLGFGSGELLGMYQGAHAIGEPNALIPERMDVVRQIKPAALDRQARKILKAMEKTAITVNGKETMRITDKLPNNYEHVGMIRLMFPGAKIIHCKRRAIDTCVSCYLLDFVGQTNHGYSYNLDHLVNQYRVYEQYMAHWRDELGIEMLDVQYEELVGDAEHGAKRIIEFLGLEWDERCSRSHETKRAVSTLSSDQVRQAMYTSSDGRWKHYEQHIGVLIDGLGVE
tara:strand:- start:30551 stop:32080 length:1530 start_codon:yes stop_codon:yes gene_type:complete